MMRVSLLLCLLGACALLAGCAPQDPLAPMATTAATAEADVPAPSQEELAARLESATLWFRFGTEPLLAPETRQIPVSPTAPYELSLMQALLNGPAASSPELNGLFPPGTRVLSTARQGRMLFVTLSGQIMNDYADEPDNWQSLPDWQTESPLRRHLAMQAIAATITENCDVDQVVILVEQGVNASESLRLRSRFYRTGSDAGLAEPLTRDESLLLSPQRTMEIVLQCWAERDWSRLYRYTARRDPATGLERPDYEAFAAQMDALPHLTRYAVQGGNVSHDGLYAAFTLDAGVMQGGQTGAIRSGLIRLCSERGVWRIGLSQLTEREVSLP